MKISGKILITVLALISVFYFYVQFPKSAFYSKIFYRKCDSHKTDLELEKLGKQFSVLTENWENNKNPINIDHYFKMKEAEKDLFSAEPCFEKINKKINSLGITDMKNESQRVKCLFTRELIKCYKKAIKIMQRYL